jgi:hypothetical protein
MSDTRQHAHELIDHIPETQLSAAVGLLEKILDPVILAQLKAPIDDEPVTEDEKLAIAEADQWFRQHADKGIPHDEAMRRLGLE